MRWRGRGGSHKTVATRRRLSPDLVHHVVPVIVRVGRGEATSPASDSPTAGEPVAGHYGLDLVPCDASGGVVPVGRKVYHTHTPCRSTANEFVNFSSFQYFYSTLYIIFFPSIFKIFLLYISPETIYCLLFLNGQAIYYSRPYLREWQSTASHEPATALDISPSLQTNTHSHLLLSTAEL